MQNDLGSQVMNGLDGGPRDDVRADDDGDAELFGLLGSGEVQKTAYKQVFGIRNRSDTNLSVIGGRYLKSISYKELRIMASSSIKSLEPSIGL